MLCGASTDWAGSIGRGALHTMVQGSTGAGSRRRSQGVALRDTGNTCSPAVETGRAADVAAEVEEPSVLWRKISPLETLLSPETEKTVVEQVQLVCVHQIT